MYELNYNTVFADYLSVTFKPDDSPFDDIHDWLIFHGYQENSVTDEKSYFKDPDDSLKGTLLMDCNQRFYQFQIQGLAFAYLRYAGVLPELLALLASTPHKVTRLDLAYQRSEPFSTAVRRYKRKYPKGRCNHGQALLDVSFNTKVFGSSLTGAVYLGDRKKRHDVAGIVYNKTYQVHDNLGIKIDSDVTRYELRFSGRVGCSLKDVLQPEPLFYEHSSMFGVKKPPTVSQWVSGGDSYHPEFPSPETYTPAQKLSRYLEFNHAFTRMLELADDVGPEGRTLLRNLLNKKLEKTFDDEK